MAGELPLLFLEGLLAFVSPCMLPMLPVYLMYLAAETEQGRRSKVEVVVDGVEFMSRRREEAAEQQQADLYSDDIPF